MYRDNCVGRARCGGDASLLEWQQCCLMGMERQGGLEANEFVKEDIFAYHSGICISTKPETSMNLKEANAPYTHIGT